MNKIARLTLFVLLLSLGLVACREEPTTEEPEPTSAPAQPTATVEEDMPDETPDEMPDETPDEMPDDDMDHGPIKVGFMGPLTGGAAFIGEEQLGFTKVAVEIFNERTGLNAGNCGRGYGNQPRHRTHCGRTLCCR